MEQGRVRLEAPADLLWIVRTLERAGYQAWAVGGAVRDALAGEHPEDWDVATSARPQQVRALFRRTVPVGIEHGTVGVIGRSRRMYEVTTFRRDVETFGRKARVAFSDSLEDDLERRDFTINAVAWHPLTEEVRDPHEGRRDLQERRLRAVGDPEERFAEDRLRVLRALRFAGRFGLRIEEATERALCASAADLHHLSAERIREELWKVLQGQRSPSATLRLYGDSGVLAHLYPELEALRSLAGRASVGSVWEEVLRSVDAIPPTRPVVRLAALLHAAGFSAADGAAAGGVAAEALGARSAALARAVLLRLKSSNAHIDRVTHLLALHTPLPSSTASDPEVRRWVRTIGREYVPDLFRLLIALCRAGPGYDAEGQKILRLFRRVRDVLRSGVPLDVAELAIGGQELRAAGIPPGPRYGRILRELLERTMEDPGLNRPERLLALVQELAIEGGE